MVIKMLLKVIYVYAFKTPNHFLPFLKVQALITGTSNPPGVAPFPVGLNLW